MSSVLQLKEVRKANCVAIKRALDHPSPDLQATIDDLKQKYKQSPGLLEEEPDLASYAVIDVAALKDIRSTGAEYMMSLEALMQNDYGPEPGYLPERDAQILNTGVCLSQVFFNTPS